MMELVLIVCLNTEPERCEERRLPYPGIGAIACMMRSLPEIAQWSTQHPAQKVVRWSCGDGAHRGVDA